MKYRAVTFSLKPVFVHGWKTYASSFALHLVKFRIIGFLIFSLNWYLLLVEIDI